MEEKFKVVNNNTKYITYYEYIDILNNNAKINNIVLWRLFKKLYKKLRLKVLILNIYKLKK